MLVRGKFFVFENGREAKYDSPNPTFKNNVFDFFEDARNYLYLWAGVDRKSDEIINGIIAVNEKRNFEHGCVKFTMHIEYH